MLQVICEATQDFFFSWQSNKASHKFTVVMFYASILENIPSIPDISVVEEWTVEAETAWRCKRSLK